MKKILSVLLTIFMLSSMFSVFALDISADSEKQYVSEFIVSTASKREDAQNYITQNGYILLDNDLNRGASNYSYLGYKTTTDPNSAIRDVLILKPDGEIDEILTNSMNGCTYTVVGGYCNSNKYTSSVNIHKTAWFGCNKYVYVTYDPNAGTPISDPIIVMNNKNPNIRNSYALLIDFWKIADLEPSISSNYAALCYNHNGYISDLNLGSGGFAIEAYKYAAMENFKLLTAFDLNEDAGGNSIFISGKITENKDDAITNIICLNGSQYESCTTWVDPNTDVVYYPIDGIVGGDYKNIVNVNEDTDGDNLYLFYTTDSRAGDPITSVAANNYTISGWEITKYGGTNNNADLNAGTGDDAVYLMFKRGALSTEGSVFSGYSTIAIVVSAVVVATGTMVGIIFTRRRKTAVSV